MPSCGCFLISPTWALTAAHCGVINDQFWVALGGTNVYKMRYWGLANKHIPHENFTYNDASRLNDIALLRIPNVELGADIQVAKFAPDNMALPDGAAVVVSGFGKTNPADLFSSEKLLLVDMKVMSHDECAEAYANHDLMIEPSQLCATWSTSINQGICYGDAGGPLAIKQEGQSDVVVGLVSFGRGLCNTMTFPNVFTRIGFYRDWIDQTIADNP